MKPYYAVIADSFHSALSSRTLWVAFLAIWGFLALLAPIGYEEDYTTTFNWLELRNGTQMKAMMARGLIDPSESETALGRLVASFDDDLKEKLRRVGRDEVRIRKDILAEALNEALEDESWYDRDAWNPTLRLRELRELDETPEEQLTDGQKRRRARLRIEAALPGIFPARTSRSIRLSYAGFAMPSEASFGKSQFLFFANQLVLPVLMNWLLGLALIFLGILVTASMVPDMLQPGSLHLLLSKPISRPMLLLCKYIGGCAFVLLCVSQLVVGLWLIAGFRLDIWNARLLWCIPVSVFLFAVYFSVSLLAGLRWRSPILSIGVTCIFAAVVILVGFLGSVFDNNITEPDKLQSIAVSGDSVIASTRGGGVQRWDEDAGAWEEVVDSRSGSDLVLAPTVLDPDHVVTAKITNGRFNPYGSGSLNVLILNREDGWKPESGLRLPIATRRLYALGGQGMLALNTSGLTRVGRQDLLDSAGLISETKEDSETIEERSGSSDEYSDAESADETEQELAGWLSSLIRMEGGPTEKFRPILPKTASLAQPTRIALSEDRKQLVVYSRGLLTRYDMPSDDSELCTEMAKRMLEGDDSLPTALAMSGDHLLVARDDEPPMVIEVSSLETQHTINLEDTSAMVVSVVGMGNHPRFAMTLSDGSCRMVVGDGEKWSVQTLFIDDITAISYVPEIDSLAVAHDIDQIDLIDAESFQIQRTIRPTLADWRFAEHYFITPLRALIPQTVELTGTVGALISGKTSFAIDQEADVERDVVQREIARPVISCSVFIVVMLTISCVYFSRRDY